MIAEKRKLFFSLLSSETDRYSVSYKSACLLSAL